MEASGGAGPDQDWLRRVNPPDNEIPVALPLSTVLARTDDVAVALLGLLVYSDGVSFDLVIRLRPGRFGASDLEEALWGPRGPGAGQGRFLLGVGFADGRRVTNRELPQPGSELVFHSSGSGGGPHGVRQSWWLSPLPPEGALQLVLRCPGLGIPETGAELDATAIRRAAADVVPLWPWVPPAQERPEPPPLDVPPESWFAG